MNNYYKYLIYLIISAFLLISFSCKSNSSVKSSFDIQGHRGARGLRPENTLSGFQFAIDLGITTLELDIAITKDRHVIVTHNPYISAHLCLNGDGSLIQKNPSDRYSGPLIKDLTLKKIKEFDCGSMNPNASQFPEPPRMNIPGEPMPTLNEVFTLIKETNSIVRLNIEMKIDPRYNVTIPEKEFVEIVVKEIQNSGMKDRVNLQSFNWHSLEWAKRIDPSIQTAGLLGSDSFRAINDSIPSPWLNGIHYSYTDGTALGILMEAKSYIDIFSPSWKLVHPTDSKFLGSTVKEIQSAGFKVIPWTINKTQIMIELINEGVDGIITDYPDSLISVIERL
jgi:glycerophosphoryl diester phosphodiesterase